MRRGLRRKKDGMKESLKERRHEKRNEVNDASGHGRAFQ